AHFRSDFLEKDSNFEKHSFVRYLNKDFLKVEFASKSSVGGFFDKFKNLFI
ncbi:MAG: hypothetical protein HXX81_04990, partial [Campylobacterales bacterium]|nr:hypothetical protein [Campylobacterales bacterium]